jgi:hypothetical protein
VAALMIAAVATLSGWVAARNKVITAAPEAYFGTLPPGSTLPSDDDCASRVRRSTREPRPANTNANHTAGVTCSAIGACSVWSKDLYDYATRVDGRFTGTTDEILQWGACKWGLDENIQRARAVKESTWYQSQVSDYTVDATLCNSFGLTAPCYQSYGILQIKASTGPGYPATYPYSKNSTAFNVDYSLAWLRGCFDGYDTWLSNQPHSTRPYTAGDIWGCVGAWYSGNWYDSGAQKYIDQVRQDLADQTWLRRRF